MMKIKLLILFCSGLFSFISILAQDAGDRAWYMDGDYKSSEISTDELMSWDFRGKGQLSAVNGQVYMAESQGSAGILLVSPTKYVGEYIVSYDVLALRP